VEEILEEEILEEEILETETEDRANPADTLG
jgi:hypothetical protein